METTPDTPTAPAQVPVPAHAPTTAPTAENQPTPAKPDPLKKESPREILNRRFHEAIKRHTQAALQTAPFPSQSQIQNGLPVALSAPSNVPSEAHSQDPSVSLSVAHTRESISPSSRLCQARSRIAAHLKGIFKPIPMPEKLRQERIKAGISVPDPKIQYVIVSGEKPANSDTTEW